MDNQAERLPVVQPVKHSSYDSFYVIVTFLDGSVWTSQEYESIERLVEVIDFVVGLGLCAVLPWKSHQQIQLEGETDE